jgi:hypothetical protein
MGKNNSPMIKFALTICFFTVFLMYGQSASLNSALKGNLVLQLGFSSNYFLNSTVEMTGSTYDFQLENAKIDQPSLGLPKPNFRDLTNAQYKVKVGYNIRRGVLLSFGLDNLKYSLPKQTLTINGQVASNYDQIGGLSGVFNQTQINMDTLGFGFAVSSAKYIHMELELVQNLFRTAKRNFVLNAVYGFGAGLLHSNATFDFGPAAYQNGIAGLSGIGVHVNAGLRFEFFKYFFIQPNLSGGMLFQNQLKMDVSEAKNVASHRVGFGQTSVVCGTVLYLGKKKNCDCPHF